MIIPARISLCLILLCISVSPAFPQDPAVLASSVNTGDFKSFRRELDPVEDLDELEINGYTVLNFCILAERADFVKYLLNRGVDLEKPSRGKTPLMLAAQLDAEILELLLPAGADPGHQIGDWTALLAAVDAGKRDAAEILEAWGATLELRGGADGPYVFRDASNGHTIIVTVDQSNRLMVDTLDDPPDELVVRTPGADSFKVFLRKPRTERKSVFRQKGKIFAISDIEGNYEDFIASLINNNVIDTGLNWVFGKGHLVLLGDFVDRGPHVMPVLWLIYKLEHDAEHAGGKVHFLLGNHELMNLQGDCRYVNIRYKILAYKLGMDAGDFCKEQTELGAWLRTKNVVEKIGDILFIHAGISQPLLQMDLSIRDINRIFRTSIDMPYYELDDQSGIILNEYGVVWYRGYITGDEHYGRMTRQALDEVLKQYRAERIVVGHSLVKDVSSDYGGKVIRIDVDHFSQTSSGILITWDRIYKAKRNGEKELMFE